MDRSIPATQSAEVDKAIETFFNNILNQLAATDVFSKSDAASIFVVYAHDNEQLGTANASCVIHLIEWLKEIRSRSVSDRAPLPLLFSRTDDSGSVRNILSSQFCLLPPDNVLDDGTIHRVHKVVVCGSDLLKKYYDDTFTAPFLEAIKLSYLKAKNEPGIRETPEDAIRQVVEAECQSNGFHHVLTELGLLMLRSPDKEHRKSVIPVTLDGSLMEWLPFWDSCDVVLKLKSTATGHQHQLFFKLLAQIYPQEHRLINQYKDCYDLTCRELQSKPTLSSRWTQQVIDMAILKAQRAISDIENASFRSQRNLVQTRSHHDTVRGVYDKLDFLTSTTEAELDEGTFKCIVEWLSTCSYELHHKFISEKLMVGSGEWIKSHPNYQHWLSTTSSSTLFIHGVRGCGKSSIFSVVINQLQGGVGDKKAQINVAYYYCSGAQSESDRANPGAILRSILRQLAVDETTRKVDPAVVSEYEKSTKHQNNVSRLGINECAKLLQQLASNKTTIIAFDAIDELDILDRSTLIQAIETLVKESNGVVKVLMTSRNDTQIKKLMEMAITIEVSGEHNYHDIISFVDDQVTALMRSRAFLDQDAPDDLLKRIRNSLISGAHEMFLWVELQVQMLIRKKSVVDVLNALEQGLADNLDKIYESTYEGFLALDDTAKTVVEGVFCWVLYAKRPLTIEALNVALRLHPELSRHPKDIRLPDLTDVCSNLVVLDSVTNILRMCHPSARDFMKRRSMFSEVQAHRLMAFASLRTCSTNLLPDPGAASTLEVIDDLSLYSAIYWPQHLKASELSNTVPPWIVNDLNDFVLDDEECAVDPAFEWWLGWIDRLLETLPPYHSLRLTHGCLSSAGGPSALPTAAVFGLSSLAELIFDRGGSIDLEQRVNDTYTPFYLACSFGHRAVASTLIQHGADKDVLCGEYGNPLQVACFKGHLDVIELLLGYGVSPRVATPAFQNALHAACEGGQSGVAELLVNATSIIETEADYEDALQMIAEAGFRDIYERLGKPNMARKFRQGTIDKTRQESRILGIIKKDRVNILQYDLESDPGMRTSIPSDAVAIAALRGQVNMVEYLHSLGLSLEEEGKFGSPLRSASLQGEYRVVKKLLDLGSDPNGKGSKGDALQGAASKGHIPIVKLLIDSGSDVNQHGPPRGSAIQAAAYHGHEAVVKLLIEEDAEIYSETYKFKDTLYAAVQGGHDQIAAFLQENYPPPRGRALPGVSRGDKHETSSYFDHRRSGVNRDDSPHPESSDEDEEPQDAKSQGESKKEEKQSIEDLHPLVLAAGIGNIESLRQGLQEHQVNEDLITEAFVAAAGQGKHRTLDVLLEEGLRHVSFLRKPKEKALIASVEGKHPECLQTLADSLNGTITVVSWGFALQIAASTGESMTEKLLDMDLIPWQSTDMRGLAASLGYALHDEIFEDPVTVCRDALKVSYSSGKNQVANLIWTWILSIGPETLMADCKEWDSLALVAAQHADISVLSQLVTLRNQCEDMADSSELPLRDLLINAIRGDKATTLDHLLKRILEKPNAYDMIAPSFLEACRTGCTDTTKALLDYDADFALDTDIVMRGIVAASAAGHGSFVLRLLDFLDDEEMERATTTSLLSGAAAGKTGVITAILADTEIGDSAQFTTIMTRVLVTACEAGHADIVQICLDQGADADETVEKAPPSVVPRKDEDVEARRFFRSHFRRPPRVAHRFPRPSGPLDSVSHPAHRFPRPPGPFFSTSNNPHRFPHPQGSIFARPPAEFDNDAANSEDGMESNGSDKTIDEEETEMTDALKASVCAFERIDAIEMVTGGEKQSVTGKSKAKQQLKIVSLILDNVSDFSARDSRLSTHPLRIAVASGTAELVQLLLDHGGADQLSPRQLESLMLVAANRNTSIGIHIILKLLDCDRRANFPTDRNKCLDSAILHAIHTAVRSLTDPVRHVDILSMKGMISSQKAANDLLKGGLQKLVKTIFRKLPAQSAEPDAFGDVLHGAAAGGDLATVKLLIKHHVNVNHIRFMFHTPLGSAAEFGHVQIIKELLRAGADIYPKRMRHQSFGKQEPAIKAILGGHAPVLKALIDHGLKTEEYSGDVPLVVLAAQQKSEAMVILLLQAGVKPKNHPLALVTAAHNGNWELMTCLLDAGADPDALASHGFYVTDKLLCSPLYAACKSGHLEAVNLLLERGADAEVDSGDFDGLPLTIAARQGQFDIVRLLLGRNADPFRRSRGPAALSRVDQNKLEKLLLDRDTTRNTRGAEPFEATDQIATKDEFLNAIQSSCDASHGIRKSFQMVKMLSDASDDPQRVFLEGLEHTSKRQNVRLFEELLQHVTPDSYLLDLASRCGSVNAVKLMIEHGFSPSTTNGDGKTPLRVAIDYQNMDLVAFLVADRMRVESQQGEPLSFNLCSMIASILESYAFSTVAKYKSIVSCEKAVANLLKIGRIGFTADQKYLDRALCLACHIGSSVITDGLLDLGGDIKAQTHLRQGPRVYKFTALYAAIYNTHPSVLKVLLSRLPAGDSEFEAAFQACLDHTSPILLETFLNQAKNFEITEQHLLLSIQRESWGRGPGETNIEMILGHHPDLKVTESVLVRLLETEIPSSMSCGSELRELWEVLLDRCDCGLTANIIEAIPHNRTWQFLHAYIENCDGSCMGSVFVPRLDSDNPRMVREREDVSEGSWVTESE
ncbi:ankyrin-repeat containing protein [Fusarium pseudoanthophilum]|uniref:Ankyrin-repeat containing protein n=1 Tax=Fusarium pseudoanthophilum TaxID=48495 RepID=A0A8H5UQV5_9HYPO|nr:ankyrin-repeat containing protein [Fusarium pseudoanthophilum]